MCFFNLKIDSWQSSVDSCQWLWKIYVHRVNGVTMLWSPKYVYFLEAPILINFLGHFFSCLDLDTSILNNQNKNGSNFLSRVTDNWICSLVALRTPSFPGTEPGIPLYLIVYWVMITNINIEKFDYVISTRQYYRLQTTLNRKSQCTEKRMKRHSLEALSIPGFISLILRSIYLILCV